MEGLVAILGAFIVPVVVIGGMCRPEGAASGFFQRLDGQLTTRQLWFQRLSVSGPSDRIVRLQVATLDRPRLILVHDRCSLVGYFIGKNIRAHIKRWRGNDHSVIMIGTNIRGLLRGTETQSYCSYCIFATSTTGFFRSHEGWSRDRSGFDFRLVIDH